MLEIELDLITRGESKSVRTLAGESTLGVFTTAIFTNVKPDSTLVDVLAVSLGTQLETPVAATSEISTASPTKPRR